MNKIYMYLNIFIKKMNIKIEDSTIEYLKYKFRIYYSNLRNVLMPLNLNQREWGFSFFSKDNKAYMKRHISFESFNDWNNFIINMVPSNIFYSSAYYKNPFSSLMDNKIWNGADLIFDLDGDHLVDNNTSYEEMLNKVKKETIKLLTILLNDFDFKEEQIEIIFSGNRGYHIHIYDSNIKSMDSTERREVVDYITGKGFDFKYYINENKDKKNYYSLKKYDSCWGKRILEYIIYWFQNEMSKNDIDKFISLKKEKILTQKNIDELISIIKKNDFYKYISLGNIDIPFKNFDKIIEYILFKNKDKFLLKYKCNIDEPVTCDIKRLIRFPNSIHSKTGLKVTKVPLSKFYSFNPLKESIIFSSDLTNVNVNKDYIVEIGNSNMIINKGKQKLPEYIAIYLMCQGVANYGFKGY